MKYNSSNKKPVFSGVKSLTADEDSLRAHVAASNYIADKPECEENFRAFMEKKAPVAATGVSQMIQRQQKPSTAP